MSLIDSTRFSPCVMTQQDCVSCRNGFCMALAETTYEENSCPFFKTAAQQKAEDKQCLDRLTDLNRYDLIQKYRGDLEGKKYGR